jgi:hypothetical protein
MSGNRTLVYHADSVESIRSDVRTAREALQTELDSMFTAVDGQLSSWSESTTSRQAERVYQRDLRDRLGGVLAALDKLEVALGHAKEAAERAETRNVALMD